MLSEISPAMQSWGIGLCFLYALIFVFLYCSTPAAEDNNDPMPIFVCIILAAVFSALTVWVLHAVGFVT